MPPTRVLVITGAAIGERMAGPAIRAAAIARVLADDGHDVVLATTAALDAEPIHRAWGDKAPVRLAQVRPSDRRGFSKLERESDVIVFQGHIMEQFARLARTDRIVVADAYDPLHLEMLEQGREQARGIWDRLVRSRVAVLNQQLSRADFILCASERQRTLYLGHLASLGRISPATYEKDPQLVGLLAIAPFGLDPTPAKHDHPALRGVVDGVDEDSRIVLWGGGLYSWFDPLTLIRAIHGLAQRRPHTRLVFLGTQHPGMAPMVIVEESRKLARDLGVLGGAVIFNSQWVAFERRGSYYVEADAGVSTHHAHIETEFSFRTRILDYIWAGIPMVVTEGDSFADLVREKQWGVVVPAEDAAALEVALERVLYDEEFAADCRARLQAVRNEFAWEHTLAPLRKFVADPHFAADVARAGGRTALARSLRNAHLRPLPVGIRRDIRMAAHYFRHGGIAELRTRIAIRRAQR